MLEPPASRKVPIPGSARDIPLTHPIFRTLFQISKLPQIPSIRIWRPYRVTSERGAETEVVHFRGIEDKSGRLMMLMTHNTDIADAWEREGEDRVGAGVDRPVDSAGEVGAEERESRIGYRVDEVADEVASR